MHYQIAFYEDLHYASNPTHRKTGLHILGQLLRGHPLAHYCVELDNEAQQSKMQAIRLYDSQLTPEISLISSYTPANPNFVRPHEALWLLQDERLQEPG